MSIKIKRIYEDASDEDGYRVLIDRLWPRGVTKEKAAIDEWNKNITPSTALRIWFGHKQERFQEFRANYIEELKGQYNELSRLKLIARHNTLTLLYAAKNPKINHAIILKEVLESLPLQTV